MNAQQTSFFYHFDTKNPWKHQVSRNIIDETAENNAKKGTKRASKFSHARPKVKPRKNRPYPLLNHATLNCNCQSGCLLQAAIGRNIVWTTRKDFDGNDYEKQNLMLFKMIDIKYHMEENRYLYHLTGVDGKKHRICRDAFLRAFGISEQRVRTIIRKLKPGSVGLIGDRRGKHRQHPKLSKKLKIAVRDHALSFNPIPSHYSRRNSKLLYFNCQDTQAKMYNDFIVKYNNMEGQYTTLKKKRSKTGAIITKPAYVSTIKSQLGDVRWRKPHKDTCNFCDQKQTALRLCKQNKDDIRNEIDEHLNMADIAYGNCNYDLYYVSRVDMVKPWEEPPEW